MHPKYGYDEFAQSVLMPCYGEIVDEMVDVMARNLGFAGDLGHGECADFARFANFSDFTNFSNFRNSENFRNSANSANPAAKERAKFAFLRGNVLDIGCGGGHFGYTMLEKCPNLRAVMLDINPYAIECARARADEWRLASRVSTIVADVHEMGFGDESFDFVISRGSMPFWRDQKLAFRQIWRVLKRGGIAYIGGGLGRAATKERIKAKMQRLGYDKKPARASLSDSDYRAICRDIGAGVIDIGRSECGFWVVLAKSRVLAR